MSTITGIAMETNEYLLWSDTRFVDNEKPFAELDMELMDDENRNRPGACAADNGAGGCTEINTLSPSWSSDSKRDSFIIWEIETCCEH